MAKSFKKFCEEWDDEWGHDDDYARQKEKKMMTRRDNRRIKAQEKKFQFEETPEQ